MASASTFLQSESVGGIASEGPITQSNGLPVSKGVGKQGEVSSIYYGDTLEPNIE